jgi:hypothetical protein
MNCLGEGRGSMLSLKLLSDNLVKGKLSELNEFKRRKQVHIKHTTLVSKPFYDGLDDHHNLHDLLYCF